MQKRHTPMEWLTKFYHHLLLYSKEGKKAKAFLESRGITEQTMRQFSLGYAPKNEKFTLEFLSNKGFNLGALANEKVLTRYQSGRKKGQIGDLFSGRITIPITDFKGDVVAFGGRSLQKNDKIKYINSPNNKHYQKSDNLFGFSQSKEYIKKKGYVILVEGYFDYLQAYQAGFKNTVAVLGTALTSNQAILLRSVTDNVVIAFDGDIAGKESAFNISKTLEKVGCQIKIANTQKGNDPDDYIRSHGKEAFGNLLKSSKPYFDSLLEYHATVNDLNTPIGRYSFVATVLEQLPTNSINERKRLLNKLSIVLGQDLKLLHDEIVRRGL